MDEQRCETQPVGAGVRYARSGDVRIAYVDFDGGPADVVLSRGSRATLVTPSGPWNGCRTSAGSLGW
jgi:hypothetical protein